MPLRQQMRCQPRNLFEKDVATVLVSFARSGNSPESVATVDLAKALVDDLYQVTITCAADGKLALQAHGDDRNLLALATSCFQWTLDLP